MTEVGQLNAIKLTYYGDCGMNPNDNAFPVMQTWADNGSVSFQSQGNETFIMWSILKIRFKAIRVLAV